MNFLYARNNLTRKLLRFCKLWFRRYGYPCVVFVVHLSTTRLLSKFYKFVNIAFWKQFKSCIVQTRLCDCTSKLLGDVVLGKKPRNSACKTLFYIFFLYMSCIHIYLYFERLRMSFSIRVQKYTCTPEKCFQNICILMQMNANIWFCTRSYSYG